MPGLYWPAFIAKLRQLYRRGGRYGKKQYLITAAPQCPEPDVILSPAMLNKAAWFDMLFIQFYNNYCSPAGSSFNFDAWSIWAQTQSLNPNVKLFIGVPADSTAAPVGGWIPLTQLQTLISSTQAQFAATGNFVSLDYFLRKLLKDLVTNRT